MEEEQQKSQNIDEDLEVPFVDDFSEEDLKTELLDTFILEFGELLEIYMKALSDIRKFRGDKLSAYNNIFRVYHTLKGDAGFFGKEFEEFTKFASYHCELVRNADEETVKDMKLRQVLSVNYARLSSVFNTLSNGGSMKAFRFRVFLRNF